MQAHISDDVYLKNTCANVESTFANKKTPD